MASEAATPSSSGISVERLPSIVRRRAIKRMGRSCGREDILGVNRRSRGIRKRAVFADRLIPLQGRELEGRGSRAERQLAVDELRRKMNEENSTYRLMLLTELLDVELEPAASNPHVLTPRRSRVNQYGPSHGGTSRALSPFSRDPIEAGSLAGSVLRSQTRIHAHRNICRSAFKVLDAPDLRDDFYLNLMDWSSSNILAIGLGTVIYMWNATTQEVTRLHDLAVDHDDICSVAWSRISGYLAVGTRRGIVQLWDPNEKKKIRDIEGHWGRVGVVRWGPHTLASGSRDSNIRLTDIRAPGSTAVELKNHRSEVCGLEWSPDSRLLASGGNDNVVNVWDVRGTHRPEWVISEHNAAVKALAWSPHNTGQLASGGGLRDGTIRIWNVSSHTCLHHKDAGAQVCGLHWSKNCNEIVSTHGYNTNSIKLWKCPQLECFATIPAHAMRIVYMSVSPDGKTVVTGAGDETVRFYQAFPGPPAHSGDVPASLHSHYQIR
ncbi:hypothetical protein BSKO_07122 [Bryopsis sp. KO-2023]|nr:hypothetical protein BSKO_07122 [Bryopsis sp. KO-2023]